MTTATEKGRRLELAVEGVDRAFTIDPLSAARGRALTDAFVRLATGQLDGVRSESLFVEAAGPQNYARMIGNHVRLLHLLDTVEDPEEFVEWGPSGIVSGDAAQVARMLTQGAVFHQWDVTADAPEDVLEARHPDHAIRQVEAERLAMCALLWQTLDMAAVERFIDDGEDDEARLKALRLYAIRAGNWTTPSSSRGASESSTPTGTSSRTRPTALSSGSVPLPVVEQKRRSPFHRR